MSRRGLLLVVLVAGAVTAAALVVVRLTTGSDEAAFVSPPLEWTPCGDVECATLAVPLDYDEPAGETIELAVARRRALDPERRLGVLLYIPGGPGGSGTAVVSNGALFSASLHERFDIVSWDPRGVSAGTQIRCAKSRDELFGDLDPTPETAGEQAAWRGAIRAYGRGCEKAAGRLLPHVSTVSSARDIDVLRAALGEPRLSLLGQSYGTAIGSVYATLFPQRIRAAVLDAAYDVSAPVGSSLVQGAAALEAALTAALDRCATDPSCPLRGDPFAVFDRLMNQLDEEPLSGFGVRVDLGDAWRAVTIGLYDEASWDGLLAALDDARRGDGRSLADLAAGFPRPDLPIAVGCLDGPRSARQLTREDAAEVISLAPRFGPYLVGAGSTICVGWPAEPDPPPELTAGGAGLVLVVGSTGDTATPLASSRALAERLDEAALLVVESNSHVSYFGSAVDGACVTEIVDRYLIDLEVPPGELVCRRE